jgi:hypothetical protein
MGLDPNWMDKLHDQLFFSDHPQHTHEHYIQVRGWTGCWGGCISAAAAAAPPLLLP